MSSPRLNPDTRPVVIATAGLVACLGLVSFAVSFAGLVSVAAWAQVPHWLRWAVPVFVDGALLAYTLAVLVQRARGESTRFAWSALAAFTAVSVAANAAHVLGAQTDPDWRSWAGAGIAGLAPLAVFAATHTVIGLAFERTRAVQPDTPAVHPQDQRVPRTDQIRLMAESPRDRACALQNQGLSQRAIADQLGVSKTTVSRWLTPTRGDA